MSKEIVLGLFLTNLISFCNTLSYGNYSLYTTTPTAAHQLKFLQSLETERYLEVIYWKRPVKLYFDVQMLIHVTDTELFLERAKHFGLEFKKTLNDVQEAFDKQTIRKYVRLRENSFTWNNYHTLEDINQWLADTANEHPNICSLISIGHSAEGRDIYAMIFKNGAKKNVFIEGGLHGNEWIAIEFVTYLINELVNRHQSEFRQSNEFNWFVIPIVNPDGFAYSHRTDRLWRKNRRLIGKEFGVDLNRNFDYSFRAFSSSADPKDDEYCGPEPFSEPETQALRNFIKHHSKNLKYYFSFHAYGQNIVLPYGDRVKHMGDYSEIENYGKQAIMRMYSKTGVKYSIGTFYETMGSKISGDSASWVKKAFKVKYVMTFILRDSGQYGHALPADQVLPVCKETMAGLQTVMTAQARYVPTNLFGSCATYNVFSVYILLCVALILNEI